LTTITSRTNPKIKLVRALYKRKFRQQNRLFICEGIHLLGEAMASDARIHSIYFSPDLLTSDYAHSLLDTASNAKLPLFAVTADVFQSIASKENPQGIMVVVHQPTAVLDDLGPENFAIGVALVSPQDPGNIGTILRTIDAVAGAGLLILGGGADPFHPGSIRASMGAIFWKPVIQTSADQFFTWSSKHHYYIYGTSAQGSTDYRLVNEYQQPLILLMGSEREGLQQSHRAMCELLVRLPMSGRSTSINLAVAAGVMLYDILEKTNQ